MLPSVYRQSMDIRTVCRYFDLEISLLDYYTEHILDCYSPEHCPEHLLAELAEHIGFDYNELKSVMYNRIVLKHFIRNLIRYRGSQTGIANAAAIDIRYRQPSEMKYNEAIPTETTWIDADNVHGIIYLFAICNTYFPDVPVDATDEEKESYKEERMRRLLDLCYLQRYVRPVGMYLLPFVAKKVDPRTDITVKAIRIPTMERNSRNGVTGTPNASFEHPYDRMHFAKVENPDDDVNIEPWVRTLYHSQLAGQLNHRYFTKPVYHITGKFLYYDHSNFMSIYEDIMTRPGGTLGMKVGDSLYNPNIPNYNYGPDPANEPESLNEQGRAVWTRVPLQYDDHGVWGDQIRYIQHGLEYAEVPDPQNDYPTYLYVKEADDGTNKNFMMNLFDAGSPYTTIDDVYIMNKAPVIDTEANPPHRVDPSVVPYNVLTNGNPDGDDVYITVHDDEDQISLIP